ncbi:enoyl-CoA hydratase-related protein [Phenylobacterium sp. J426]|uniref:enoyl-CoA hydratase-related protein n=1 Tax=Phenylobacterium sp. J426 TaxID=2898439 RepID=UPI00215163B4|nr:enoyl-CoA hydratase-related protein [Phenylobacterium sp. J426]MCR5873301.1 enoyl-CoA hydratase-related protein [Phenylobacterium sp. J426]
MSNHILSESSGGVLTLTMNRPEKKNALTRAMYQALADGIDAADADPDIRCIIIQANGDMFTAGNDLADFAAVNRGDPDANAAREDGNPLLNALERAKTPIVAALNGRAVGVGVTMLLHCDLVYVAEDALLTTPFVNLALVPEAASSMLLPARIGHARAFAMFVLGEAVDARKAEAWGLANAVVPAGDLRPRARAAAEAVASRAASSVAATKALMRRPAETVRERYKEEGRLFAAQLKTADAAEAFAAFAEKRPPDFSKARSKTPA